MLRIGQHAQQNSPRPTNLTRMQFAEPSEPMVSPTALSRSTEGSVHPTKKVIGAVSANMDTKARMFYYRIEVVSAAIEFVKVIKSINSST